MSAVKKDDHATTPETLYTLSLTDASATFLMSLGNGTEGDIIAHGPNAGVLYHASGDRVSAFELINLATLTTTMINPLSSSESYGLG